MDEEDEFNFGQWCSVCDKAIPQVGVEPSSAGATSPSPNPNTPSPTLTSHKKNRNKDGPQPPSAVLAGIAPGHPMPQHRRTKSSTKLHHAVGGKHHTTHHSHHGHGSHGHRKSTTTFAALAPLHPSSSPPAQPPSLAAPPDEMPSPASISSSLNPLASSLYCSEECQRIDEMRSRLAFADLGPSASSSNFQPHHPNSAVLPLSQRRTSSSLSLANNTHSYSTPNLQQLSQYSPSFAPSYPQSYHQSNPPLHPVASASSLALATSNGLDFSTRRNSRGSAGEGAYSFRPSLMQRLPSSDDGNGSGRPLSNSSWRRGSTDSLASMGEAEEGFERSARPPSALSALRRMTPISTTSAASPPSHQAAHLAPHPHHNRSQSHSHQRQRPVSMSRHNSDASRPSAFRNGSEDGRNGTESSDSDRKREKGKGRQITKSVDESGCELGQESLSMVEAASPRLENATARPSPVMTRRPSRSASSASLALMGTSFGATSRSYDPSKASWSLPHRSESTASLSSLVVQGRMVPVGATPIPSSNLSVSQSSPSSNSSSFAHSHSSARSSQRSTAGSSEPYPYKSKRNASSSSLGYASRSPTYLSSSAGSFLPPPVPTRDISSKSRGRSRGGLMMTPSGSSLSNAASSYGSAGGGGGGTGKNGGGFGVSGNQLSSSTTTTPNANHSFSKPSARRTSSASERTPTQSLSKASTLPPNATSVVAATGTPAYLSIGMSKQRSMNPHFDLGPSSPANAAGMNNPTLSHLYPSPGKMAPPSRNWSWDHLPVPTYSAMDLDKFRSDKTTKENAERLGAKVTAQQAAEQQPNPQPQQPRERKRLFYFSDSGE